MLAISQEDKRTPLTEMAVLMCEFFGHKETSHHYFMSTFENAFDVIWELNLAYKVEFDENKTEKYLTKAKSSSFPAYIHVFDEVNIRRQLARANNNLDQIDFNNMFVCFFNLVICHGQMHVTKVFSSNFMAFELEPKFLKLADSLIKIGLLEAIKTNSSSLSKVQKYVWNKAILSILIQAEYYYFSDHYWIKKPSSYLITRDGRNVRRIMKSLDSYFIYQLEGQSFTHCCNLFGQHIHNGIKPAPTKYIKNDIINIENFDEEKDLEEKRRLFYFLSNHKTWNYEPLDK